jgi:hypothetical protein
MSIQLLLAAAGFVATIVGVAWHVRRKAEERRRAEEARTAEFMASITGAPPPAAGIAAPAAVKSAVAAPAVPLAPSPGGDIALQKLLFEAAHKAGEAGEPALAIQLYARLLARYPATAFASPAREAAATQKKKLLR